MFSRFINTLLDLLSLLVELFETRFLNITYRRRVFRPARLVLQRGPHSGFEDWVRR